MSGFRIETEQVVQTRHKIMLDVPMPGSRMVEALGFAQAQMRESGNHGEPIVSIAPGLLPGDDRITLTYTLMETQPGDEPEPEPKPEPKKRGPRGPYKKRVGSASTSSSSSSKPSDPPPSEEPVVLPFSVNRTPVPLTAERALLMLLQPSGTYQFRFDRNETLTAYRKCLRDAVRSFKASTKMEVLTELSVDRSHDLIVVSTVKD